MTSLMVSSVQSFISRRTICWNGYTRIDSLSRVFGSAGLEETTEKKRWRMRMTRINRLLIALLAVLVLACPVLFALRHAHAQGPAPGSSTSATSAVPVETSWVVPDIDKLADDEVSDPAHRFAGNNLNRTSLPRTRCSLAPDPDGYAMALPRLRRSRSSSPSRDIPSTVPQSLATWSCGFWRPVPVLAPRQSTLLPQKTRRSIHPLESFWKTPFQDGYQRCLCLSAALPG
jgi:hypothetical protein